MSCIAEFQGKCADEEGSGRPEGDDAGASPGDTGPEMPGITGREREVLRLVGLGMSNAETATTLYITTGTAKTHVARLLAKLGAGDRYSSSSPRTGPAWYRRRTERIMPTRRPHPGQQEDDAVGVHFAEERA